MSTTRIVTEPSVRVEMSACRNCGAKLDAATGMSGEAQPSPDDFSICFQCGCVSCFDENLKLRVPTMVELTEFEAIPELAAMRHEARTKFANRRKK